MSAKINYKINNFYYFSIDSYDEYLNEWKIIII